MYSEVLYEDETFRSREFAALVASKVFYHLGAFEESLNYALGAGDLFNVTDDSEYVETIIGEWSNKNTSFILLTDLVLISVSDVWLEYSWKADSLAFSVYVSLSQMHRPLHQASGGEC